MANVSYIFIPDFVSQQLSVFFVVYNNTHWSETECSVSDEEIAIVVIANLYTLNHTTTVHCIRTAIIVYWYSTARVDELLKQLVPVNVTCNTSQ